MYEALLEFPEGWRVLEQNRFKGKDMDIFRNYTIWRTVEFEFLEPLIFETSQ